MRLFLALSLILHLSGVPAAVVEPCLGLVQQELGCCEQTRAGAATTSVSDMALGVPCDCGCRLTSPEEMPTPGVVSTLPEAASSHTTAGSLADVPVTPGSGGPDVSAPAPPGTPVSLTSSTSFLSGGGFRC